MENIRQLQAFISTSKIRSNILKSLKEKDLRQAEISVAIKEKQPNVSKALSELEKRGLTLCLTPDKKAWKVYGITNLGKKVLG
jgi:predicted transcriptional regulator